MRIGDLAAKTATPAETIRYYEREGLIPRVLRADNKYRAYTASHVERLAFIRRCRNLDMTLDEIRQLLRFRDQPQADCSRVDLLLDEHIGHVRQRIRELRSLEKSLKMLRASCQSPRDAGECGILRDLGEPKGFKNEPALNRRQPTGGIHGRRVG